MSCVGITTHVAKVQVMGHRSIGEGIRPRNCLLPQQQHYKVPTPLQSSMTNMATDMHWVYWLPSGQGWSYTSVVQL